MKKRGLVKALLVLILLLYCNSSSAEDSTSLSATEKAFLDDCASIISSSIARNDTRHPVFHGCIDWHSSVHGHWALFRLARTIEKHEALGLKAHESLEEKGLVDELNYLKRKPRFEMPYGRAWFLRLAIEYESWLKENGLEENKAFKELADEIAESLTNFYDSHAPSADTREYANDSWAFVNLYEFFAHRKNDAKLQLVNNRIKEYFLKNKCSFKFSDDFRNPDFFSVFGNWIFLISETQGPDAVNDILREYELSEEDIGPVIDLKRNSHHLGMNWSRAWALKSLERASQNEKDKKRFARAYLDHLNTGFAIHKTSHASYYSYGHWVPQFAVYAITD